MRTLTGWRRRVARRTRSPAYPLVLADAEILEPLVAEGNFIMNERSQGPDGRGLVSARRDGHFGASTGCIGVLPPWSLRDGLPPLSDSGCV